MGLIALSYGVALTLNTYGFLAVFAAGLAMRKIEAQEVGHDTSPERCWMVCPQRKLMSVRLPMPPLPPST